MMDTIDTMASTSTRVEYVIPLTDVSSRFSEDEDDEESSSDDDELWRQWQTAEESVAAAASASIAFSYQEPLEDDSSSCDSSASSHSVSIASDDFTDSSCDDSSDSSSSSDYHSGSSDDDDDEEEDSDDDDSQDWGYKFFHDHHSRIRFSAEVQIHDTIARSDYTPQERMDSFLTPKDKKAQWFYQNKAIAKLEWWMEETPEVRVQYKNNNNNNNDHFVPRGLHQMTDKGYDRMNMFKNACVEAVLQEQENQWKAAGGNEEDNPGVLWDFDRMAEVSKQVSRGGIMEAIKIAKRDEQQAQKAYRQMEREEANKNKKKKKLEAKPSNRNNPIQGIDHEVALPILKPKSMMTNHPSLSPTATPTTVTITLTSSSHLESTESAPLVVRVKKPQEESPSQPLDYLEVTSVDSADRSLLTMDDRSIATPPEEEDEEEKKQEEETHKPKQPLPSQNLVRPKIVRRLSMEEQQHPALIRSPERSPLRKVLESPPQGLTSGRSRSSRSPTSRLDVPKLQSKSSSRSSSSSRSRNSRSSFSGREEQAHPMISLRNQTSSRSLPDTTFWTKQDASEESWNPTIPGKQQQQRKRDLLNRQRSTGSFVASAESWKPTSFDKRGMLQKRRSTGSLQRNLDILSPLRPKKTKATSSFSLDNSSSGGVSKRRVSPPSRRRNVQETNKNHPNMMKSLPKQPTSQLDTIVQQPQKRTTTLKQQTLAGSVVLDQEPHHPPHDSITVIKRQSVESLLLQKGRQRSSPSKKLRGTLNATFSFQPQQ